ncbi:MAG: PilZ domain-containing protein [Pseudomonadota bacterium]
MSREKRKAERRPIQTQVEFFVDADIINAVAVDFSETGIRFSTENPILIRMRFDAPEGRSEKTARLVWAGKSPEEHFQYGLEFIPDPEEEGPDFFTS